VPAAQRHELADSLGAGGARVAGPIGRAIQDAYVSALNSGLRLGAAVAVVGAVLAWALIAPGVPARGDAGGAATAQEREDAEALAEVA
jgi:hypothetical protein